MHHLRLSLAAGALTVALALPAYAGWMDTTVTPPPPPPPPPTTGGMRITDVAAGEMNCSSLTADPVMEIALNLAQSVLAMF